MPTPVHSKVTKVYANSLDLTTYMNSAETDISVDKVESSMFGASYKSYVPGYQDGTFTGQGMFNHTPDASGLVAALEAALSGSSMWVHLPEGDILGVPALVVQGPQTDLKGTSAVADIVRANFSVQKSSSSGPAIVGCPKAVFSSIGNLPQTEAQDYGSATTGGGELNYMLFALSGTGTPTCHVRWQTSPDASTWTTIADTGALAAAGYGRIVVASGVTIDRHSRIQLATAGSTISVTAWAAFRRYSTGGF